MSVLNFEFMSSLSSPLVKPQFFLYFCFVNEFICIIFLILHISYIIFVFLGLIYFTHYDNLQVHSCCCKWLDNLFSHTRIDKCNVCVCVCVCVCVHALQVISKEKQHSRERQTAGMHREEHTRFCNVVSSRVSLAFMI